MFLEIFNPYQNILVTLLKHKRNFPHMYSQTFLCYYYGIFKNIYLLTNPQSFLCRLRNISLKCFYYSLRKKETANRIHAIEL